ncbi:hypothetical protein Efla_002075 [Eimeria flavescens]
MLKTGLARFQSPAIEAGCFLRRVHPKISTGFPAHARAGGCARALTSRPREQASSHAACVSTFSNFRRLADGAVPSTAAEEGAASAPARKLGCAMWRPTLRCLSTAPAPRLRIWLAGAPSPPALWRQLLGWDPQASVGLMRELGLPVKTPELQGLAVGGSGALAIVGGRLLEAPVMNTKASQRGPPSSLQFKALQPDPPEAAGCSQAELSRHLRLSESEGIPLLWGQSGVEARHSDEGSEPAEFVKLAAGLRHCAALTKHGVLYTWGRGNSWGAGSPLGHGDFKNRLRPTIVSQFVASQEFVVDVACGAASTCVVTSSGLVYSSGAADYGLNGSGMLVGSKAFKELESFRGVLSPAFLEVQRHNEERQLQELEAMKEKLVQEGAGPGRLTMRPFEASQGDLEGTQRSNRASIASHARKDGRRLQQPKVMCGQYHCGLLTPDGTLWLWGRNDCLQLGQEKIVMASGGESNYPLLAEFFTRSDVRLESCALGPGHSLALARNGMVYEWGGPEAAPPHAVDLHWRYSESAFKSRVTKVACGGLTASVGFSALLTENGNAFIWGPGASTLPLAVGAPKGNSPVQISPSLFAGEQARYQEACGVKIVDIAAGPQGCLIVTSHDHQS